MQSESVQNKVTDVFPEYKSALAPPRHLYEVDSFGPSGCKSVKTGIPPSFLTYFQSNRKKNDFRLQKTTVLDTMIGDFGMSHPSELVAFPKCPSLAAFHLHRKSMLVITLSAFQFSSRKPR